MENQDFEPKTLEEEVKELDTKEEIPQEEVEKLVNEAEELKEEYLNEMKLFKEEKEKFKLAASGIPKKHLETALKIKQSFDSEEGDMLLDFLRGTNGLTTTTRARRGSVTKKKELFDIYKDSFKGY